MLKNTIVENCLREIVRICVDEYRKLQSEPKQLSPEKATKPFTPRLISVGDWKKYHDIPTEGSLRSLIFFSKDNGFDRYVRRIGRRVYIHEQEFFRWLEDTNSR